MSSFANRNFAHKLYAVFRPSYPDKLYQTILEYHGDRPRSLVLDLGTGHGTVARHLSRYFAKVIGNDVSAGMVAEARRLSSSTTNIEFHESKAESNPFVRDQQCDMVTAAECVHWFDYHTFWPEMARILQPGGTLALWGYHQHVLVDYPIANSILEKFNTSMDEGSFGPYWPQPGRSILANNLRDIIPPISDWEGVQRIEYEPRSEGTDTGSGVKLMSNKMTIGSMAEYMRTWSAYHEWQKQWPERTRRPIDIDKTTSTTTSQGDVIDELIDEMQEADPQLAVRGGKRGILDVEVELEFFSVLILARRRQDHT